MPYRWGLLLVVLMAVEGMAWIMVVPERVGPWTFVQLNGLVFGMFLTGLLSAKGGHQRQSLSDTLREIERPPARITR
jgi:hypothetical protein